jgi:hypothetical protein
MRPCRAIVGFILLVIVASLFGSSPTWRSDTTSGCRYQIPERWQSYGVQWVGSCDAGLAQGLGILRATEQGKVTEVFFGRLDRGVLIIGVIDTPDGYIAGRYSAGSLVKDGDRNIYINAFRDASEAAHKASEYYRQKGNDASARYYAEKATKLENQMD